MVTVAAIGLGLGPRADASAPTSTGSSCGAASSSLLYGGADTAVHEIYSLLLDDPQVATDLAHITGSTTLAEAVADGDSAQIVAATHAIVYTPFWHIVRLRVLSTSGRVLADVGGPYILAPVSGQITYNGTVVGSFVMSVQDDRGYKKLVGRKWVRMPVEIYRDGRPLIGSLAHPPPHPPPAGPLAIDGDNFTVDAFTLNAFPAGNLRVAVLVTPPSAAQMAESCPQLRLDTIAAFVAHIAASLPAAGFSFQRNASLFVKEAYPYAQGPDLRFRRLAARVRLERVIRCRRRPAAAAAPRRGRGQLRRLGVARGLLRAVPAGPYLRPPAGEPAAG